MGFCSSVGVWDEQTARRFSKCKVKSVLSKGARSPVLLRLGFYRPLVTRAHCPACRAPYTSRGASAEGPTCQCRRCKRCEFIPGLGRSPGGGQGNPLQYSCLESPMDRGAWRARVHGVIQSQTQLKQLSMHVHSLSNFHAP